MTVNYRLQCVRPPDTMFQIMSVDNDRNGAVVFASAVC